jgi:hypothetical protein
MVSVKACKSSAMLQFVTLLAFSTMVMTGRSSHGDPPRVMSLRSPGCRCEMGTVTH